MGCLKPAQLSEIHGRCACAGADDDIVIQTFKKQQQSYRNLLEGMKVWCGATSLCTSPV